MTVVDLPDLGAGVALAGPRATCDAATLGSGWIACWVPTRGGVAPGAGRGGPADRAAAGGGRPQRPQPQPPGRVAPGRRRPADHVAGRKPGAAARGGEAPARRRRRWPPRRSPPRRERARLAQRRGGRPSPAGASPAPAAPPGCCCGCERLYFCCRTCGAARRASGEAQLLMGANSRGAGRGGPDLAAAVARLPARATSCTCWSTWSACSASAAFWSACWAGGGSWCCTAPARWPGGWPARSCGDAGCRWAPRARIWGLMGAALALVTSGPALLPG